MEILTSIPPALRGRGAMRCVPIKHPACGEMFLWEHDAGRAVTCPKCREAFTFADDDATFDQTHNGQQA